MFTIRQATLADIPAMQRIFQDAKAKMRAAGNLHQWTDGYPSDALLQEDIRRGFSYVVEDEEPHTAGSPHLLATFVLAICPDPTYRHIYQGAWLDDTLPYGTIHRIASRQGVHGIMPCVLDWAFARIPNLRVDTHRDNLPMQHLIQKYGFTYCGIIYLQNGDERLAYQRVST